MSIDESPRLMKVVYWLNWSIDESCLFMKVKMVNEVIACDVSPVAMFKNCFLVSNKIKPSLHLCYWRLNPHLGLPWSAYNMKSFNENDEIWKFLKNLICENSTLLINSAEQLSLGEWYFLLDNTISWYCAQKLYFVSWQLFT